MDTNSRKVFQGRRGVVVVNYRVVAVMRGEKDRKLTKKSAKERYPTSKQR